MGGKFDKSFNEGVWNGVQKFTKRLSAISRIKMKEEFDNRVNLSFEELKSQIENRLNKYYKNLQKKQVLRF